VIHFKAHASTQNFKHHQAMTSPAETYPSVIALAWQVRHELCSTYDKPTNSFSWPETRHVRSPFARSGSSLTAMPSRRKASSIRRELLTTTPTHRNQIPSAGIMKALKLQQHSQQSQSSARGTRQLPCLPPIVERPAEHGFRRS
jgi:hypothetical protein